MTTPVRIAILGCGAIGSLYAAHLSRTTDAEVWVVDPWEEHIAAIRATGLRVTGEAAFLARPHAVTDARELPPCRLAIVATKSQHTRAAVTAAAPALRDAAVASVQNGIGNEEQIAETLPRVIRGTIVTAGAITAPGVVRYDAPGPTWLGPFEPAPAEPEEINLLARLLTEGGLKTNAVPDARGPQWSKVVFNAATSPIAALTGLPMGPICTDPALRTQVNHLIEEALAVCAAANITLTVDPHAAIDEAIREAYNHKPSMLQDTQARRPTEIAVLNGGIAAEARRTQVPTPTHDTMIALIKGLESSWNPTPTEPATTPTFDPHVTRKM